MRFLKRVLSSFYFALVSVGYRFFLFFFLLIINPFNEIAF